MLLNEQLANALIPVLSSYADESETYDIVVFCTSQDFEPMYELSTKEAEELINKLLVEKNYEIPDKFVSLIFHITLQYRYYIELDLEDEDVSPSSKAELESDLKQLQDLIQFIDTYCKKNSIYVF